MMSAVPKKRSKSLQVAPPAATGNAGPQFERKVGAFCLLSMLIGGEPRGLPGATTGPLNSSNVDRAVHLMMSLSGPRMPMAPARLSKYKQSGH
jgi:hypothetical protein